jgi:hypothetical protein
MLTLYLFLYKIVIAIHLQFACDSTVKILTVEKEKSDIGTGSSQPKTSQVYHLLVCL